jgi:putative ABC transport system substrate-binding protein
VAALQATRTVPIVFATATDPVGGGLVTSLARPGGNVTGFTTFEYGSSAKWRSCSSRSLRALRSRGR